MSTNPNTIEEQLVVLREQLPPPLRRKVPKPAKKPAAKKAKTSKKVKRATAEAAPPVETTNIVEFKPRQDIVRAEVTGTRILYEGGIVEFGIRPGSTQLVSKSYASEQPFLSTCVSVGGGYALVRIFGDGLDVIDLTRSDRIKGRVRIVEERTTVGPRAIVEIVRARGKVDEELRFHPHLSKNGSSRPAYAVRIPGTTDAGIEVISSTPNQEQEAA